MLVEWIVPEPDPKLRLTLDQIDISTLDFEDVSWICSSTMKQYRDEFNALDGFIDRVVKLIREDPTKMKGKRQAYAKVVRGYPVREDINYIPNPSYKTPTVFPTYPEQFIEINTQKSLPYKKIPFIRKPRSSSCRLQ